MIVFDTDVLSMFAKIDAVDVLKCFFDEKVVMTPKIRDEYVFSRGKKTTRLHKIARD